MRQRKSLLTAHPELEEYKDLLRKEAICSRKVVGAIVMNCNPFTKGHRYLVEEAASQCDFLYIFVVQEDKSVFPFEDRFALVCKGTDDIKNVKVLPSGKFIISALTFSEYFDKANLQGTAVDTSLDVEIFAEQIAPILDINVRFVGTEPLDLVTQQYNERMKAVLPKYGIDVVEVSRKEDENGVISASRVRKCLQESNWTAIERLCPESTCIYLRNRFNNNGQNDNR